MMGLSRSVVPRCATVATWARSAAQDGGSAAHRGSARPVRHDDQTGCTGDSRHRRHLLCRPWRPATGVLECAHDERGFAPIHIYHAASGTPVVTILRPARTPKGTEVRTVIEFSEFLARRQSHRLRKNSSGRRRSSPLLWHRRGGEAVLDQAADRFTAQLDRVGLTPFTDLNNNWLRQAYGHGRIAAGGWPPASALFAVYRY